MREERKKCVRKKRDWGEGKDLRHERGEEKFTRNKREIKGEWKKGLRMRESGEEKVLEIKERDRESGGKVTRNARGKREAKEVRGEWKWVLK